MPTSPTPPPVPADAREAASLAVLSAFHELHPRIPGIAKGDCHCNLLTEVALDVAAPILLAAGHTAAAADLPSDTGEILAWLRRHGLSDTPGIGAVLPAIRRDILGVCSACGPRIAEGKTDA